MSTGTKGERFGELGVGVLTLFACGGRRVDAFAQDWGVTNICRTRPWLLVAKPCSDVNPCPLNFGELPVRAVISGFEQRPSSVKLR